MSHSWLATNPGVKGPANSNESVASADRDNSKQFRIILELLRKSNVRVWFAETRLIRAPRQWGDARRKVDRYGPPERGTAARRIWHLSIVKPAEYFLPVTLSLALELCDALRQQYVHLGIAVGAWDAGLSCSGHIHLIGGWDLG